MMVNPYLLVFVTLLMTFFTNYILNLSFIKGGILTLFSISLAYIIYMASKQKKRYSILEEDLNPEKFIKETHNAYKYAGKDKELNSLYNLDLAFGYLSLGDFARALDHLNKIDSNYLPKINKSILAYYNALMIAYYENDCRDGLEEVYELAEAYKSRGKLADSLMLLIKANKAFYQGDYRANREFLTSYIEKNDKNMSKRLRLEITLDLGLVDEKEGNLEEAKVKYSQVIQEAKDLYIGEKAREGLKRLKKTLNRKL